MTATTHDTDVLESARRAREASRALALATRQVKDAALHAMADGLLAASAQVLAANADLLLIVLLLAAAYLVVAHRMLRHHVGEPVLALLRQEREFA